MSTCKHAEFIAAREMAEVHKRTFEQGDRAGNRLALAKVLRIVRNAKKPLPHESYVQSAASVVMLAVMGHCKQSSALVFLKGITDAMVDAFPEEVKALTLGVFDEVKSNGLYKKDAWRKAD